MLAGKGQRVGEQRGCRQCASGIMGIIEQQQTGTRRDIVRHLGEIGQESIARLQRNAIKIGTCLTGR